MVIWISEVGLMNYNSLVTSKLINNFGLTIMLNITPIMQSRSSISKAMVKLLKLMIRISVASLFLSQMAVLLE